MKNVLATRATTTDIFPFQAPPLPGDQNNQLLSPLPLTPRSAASSTAFSFDSLSEQDHHLLASGAPGASPRTPRGGRSRRRGAKGNKAAASEETKESIEAKKVNISHLKI